MLKFLIPIYPDESVYSYLCRLYNHSGFLCHRHFAEEVFARWNESPDYNFINVLNDGCKSALNGDISLESLIIGHTLFAYYARFLPKERRDRALNHALLNKPLLHQSLPVHTNVENYYLRYCPKCVVADRKQYGESYFHLQHQLPYIHVCSKHCCKLLDTRLPNTKRSATLISLEQLLAEDGIGKAVQLEETDINVQVARYIQHVQEQPLNFDTHTLVGDYLTNNLKSPYVSPRGEQRNLVELEMDMADYFKELGYYDLTKQRLAYLFRNQSFNPYHVMLTAIFEGISPQDLCTFAGYTEQKTVIFDRKVRELSQQGKGCYEIGRIMKVNHEVIRQILMGNYDKPKNNFVPYKSQKWDWKTIDDNCCQEFENKVKAFVADNPKGLISRRVVAELFGLQDKSLRNLPMLQQIIRNYKNLRKRQNDKTSQPD